MVIEIRSINHDAGDAEAIGKIDDDGSVLEGQRELGENGVLGYLDLVDDPSELVPLLTGPRILAVDLDTEDEKGIDKADHRDPSEVLRDPDEPTTNSLAIKEDRRVYVSNMMEVPDGAVAHHDDEEGLYYEREPEPEDETEKAAGSLVEFLDSLLGR